MRRNRRIAIQRFLNRPLWGHSPVPADAVADTDLLPEDEFPVRCPKCDYLLRGLPDGRCPECGEPFERGELLVRQYVFEHGYAMWKATSAGRWAHRLLKAGLGLTLLVQLGAMVTRYLLGQQLPPASMDRVGRWLILVQFPAVIVPGALMLGAAGVCVVQWRRMAGKRRRVLAAVGVPG